jgi:hypothetical protein
MKLQTLVRQFCKDTTSRLASESVGPISGPNPRTRGVAHAIVFCALLMSLLGSSIGSAAVFLDVTSLTAPSGPGLFTGFSGTLGGIGVTGSVSTGGGPAAFFFTAPGTAIGDSTVDGSSPQYSYSSVFSPTILTTDRVGFNYTGTATNLVTLSFTASVTDPVFHFANLGGGGFSFAGTPGFVSLTLLNGNNGPDGNGIDPTFGGVPYTSAIVRDAAPSPTDPTPPPTSDPVPSGPRSAYGSVRLNGTFTTVTMAIDGMGFADNGSFTVSNVPEPGAAMLTVFGLLTLGLKRRRG